MKLHEHAEYNSCRLTTMKILFFGILTESHYIFEDILYIKKIYLFLSMSLFKQL